MDSAQVSKSPPLLVSVQRRQSMEVLPAPLEGASVSLRQNDGDVISQRYQHERSSLPIPAPSPPPQTISSGDNTGTSRPSTGRSQHTPSTDYRKRGLESAPLIGVGLEPPTFISSPTAGLLTMSTPTGLSPTKDPYRGPLASASSCSPGPVGYYPSSSYKQPQPVASLHAAPTSAGAFRPHNNAFGTYPSTQPLYTTTRQSAAGVAAAAAAAAAGLGGQPASNTAGLPQGQINTEDHHLHGSGGGHWYGGPATKETSCGGASLASLDSSAFFAITQAPQSSTSDLADLNQPDLERMLLRGSPVTAAATPPGDVQMPMIAAIAQQQQQQQQQDRPQSGVKPGLLREFDTFDGRLVNGVGSDDFPAVVGGFCGGYVGGCYDSSGDSSGDNAGGRGGSGSAGVSHERGVGSSTHEERGDETTGVPRTRNNTSSSSQGDVAPIVGDRDNGCHGSPPRGSSSGMPYGLSSLAAYRGAIQGGPRSVEGRGGGGGMGPVGGGGVAADGGDAGGPRQDAVSGVVASSCGAMLASPRRGMLSPSSRARCTSSGGGAASSDPSGDGSRGRDGGRGRGGGGDPGGAVAAAKTTASVGTSSSHSVLTSVGLLTSVGVTSESSAAAAAAAGRMRASGAGGKAACAGAGGDRGGENRRAMIASGQQEYTRGISAPSRLPGHPIPRRPQAGQGQAAHEGRHGARAEPSSYFSLVQQQHRQQTQASRRATEAAYGAVAAQAKDVDMGAGTGGGIDDGGNEDYDEAADDGELQHQIRNGTLFGIDLLGGIGGLDRHGLATTAAAASASASGGEDEEEDERYANEDDAESGAESDGVIGGEGAGDGSGDVDSGSRSDAYSDGNSAANSGGGGGGSGSSSSGFGDGSDGLEGAGEAAMTSGGEDNYAMLGVYEAEDGVRDDELEESTDNHEDDIKGEPTAAKKSKRRGGVGSNGGRARRPSRKKVKKPVWSQLRKACDRCTSKKVKCDGKEGCSQCSRAGATCHFSICRRSGPRDSNGHKTGTLGPIIPRDGYEKVTGRRGSCRTSSPCRFAFADGQSKTEHYHCRTPGCEYASKTMEKLMAHRQERHPESALASAPAAATEVKPPPPQQEQQQQQQQHKRPNPQRRAGDKSTLQPQPQQKQKKRKLEAITFQNPSPAAQPAAAPAFKLSSPQQQQQQGGGVAPPPTLLVVRRGSDFNGE